MKQHELITGIRTLAVMSLGIAVAGCATIDHTHETKGAPGPATVKVEGCYTVTYVQGGRPHANPRNQYCVEQVDRTYYLFPGLGLESWGDEGIELVPDGENKYKFTVTIADHQPAPDNHPAEHNNFQIHFLPNGKALLTGVGASPSVHGGTAHSLQ